MSDDKDTLPSDREDATMKPTRPNDDQAKTSPTKPTPDDKTEADPSEQPS